MVLKRALGCLLFMTLASGMMLAQKVAHTTPSKHITPYRDTSHIQTLFSNLGPSTTDAYNDTTGYYVLGPSNSVGLSEQWIALPFTPNKNSTVKGLQAAVQYISGTSLVDLGLYSDAGGFVGTVLASGSATKIATFGTCCALTDAVISPTSITGGTQYWVVASSDDTNGPDFTGVFDASNQSNIGADVAQGGWFVFSGLVPAMAVKGTVP